MNGIIKTLVFSLAFVPVLAMADGTATWKVKNQGTMSVAWQTDGALRMNMPGKSKGYLLMREGKMYMVSTRKGKPEVIELNGMLKALGGLSDNVDKEGKVLSDATITSVTNTGVRKTVAGIHGSVFKVTAREANGKTRSVRMVLTDDPAVVDMTQAYIDAFGSLMASDDAMTQLMGKLPADMHGVLEVVGKAKLTSISTKAPEASEFQLPAPPKDIGAMVRKIMQGMPSK